MRYLILPLLTASFLCLAPGAEHTNFVGNWQLDTASTPSIDGKQVTFATLTIDYRQKMIHLSKTFNFADGNKAVAEEWKLFGQQASGGNVEPRAGGAHAVDLR